MFSYSFGFEKHGVLHRENDVPVSLLSLTPQIKTICILIVVGGALTNMDECK